MHGFIALYLIACRDPTNRNSCARSTRSYARSRLKAMARRGPLLAVLADRAHGDLLVLLAHVRSVIIRREFGCTIKRMVAPATLFVGAPT